MKRIPLTAQKRTVVGRKVKQLRKQGFVPASVFGNQIQSVSIQVSTEAMRKVYQEAGETGLIDLQEGQEVRPVLIKNIQSHPVTGAMLHVDFYQVNLKEKVTAQVPLEQTGTAPAVTNNIGVLLTLADEVEVEALPTDLPENIVVDIASLTQVDDVIKVSNLQIPQGVTILTDPETEVVKIGELVQAEPEPEPVTEGEEAVAEGAEKGVEGEEGKEGEKEQGPEKTEAKVKDTADKGKEKAKE
ncbi:50S ribosomal protein L25 [Candidatus Microgenomates bacterium]|nr:MAG: 50S ribosomal protein L25 [Candidatus Microgenomates bacterium]